MTRLSLDSLIVSDNNLKINDITAADNITLHKNTPQLFYFIDVSLSNTCIV